MPGTVFITLGFQLSSLGPTCFLVMPLCATYFHNCSRLGPVKFRTEPEIIFLYVADAYYLTVWNL